MDIAFGRLGDYLVAFSDRPVGAERDQIWTSPVAYWLFVPVRILLFQQNNKFTAEDIGRIKAHNKSVQWYKTKLEILTELMLAESGSG